MPKDTKSLGNNKAPACESRGFVHKKRGVHFDTPPQLTETALPTGKLSAYVANGILNVQTRMKCGHDYFT